MDIKNYQKLAATTLKNSNESLTATEIALIANCLGLAGESGELIDYIKKVVWHRHGKIDSQESLDFIKKELGDVLWYVAAICTTANIDLEEVADANIAKLKLRYPEGFTTEASVNRVDTQSLVSSTAVVEDYDDDNEDWEKVQSWGYLDTLANNKTEDYHEIYESYDTWEELQAYNNENESNIFGTGLSTLDDEAGYDSCEQLEDSTDLETELEYAEQEYMRAGLA
jgi:NTP pyrophosphatase (non-canonical NTP hydrolase)